jgi:acyl carrier protein
VIFVPFEKLRSIIAEQFTVNEDSITMDTSFIDDLGADSLDAVELIMAIEEQFDLQEIDEDAVAELYTVGDVCNYISNYE